ncbi:glycosyltransferase family 4 protein [Candidatus Pacearchaeota archaeon]|nr:glycosyltransferase family 4 protein [Candidatus Pacearchaeota archaeon]
MKKIKVYLQHPWRFPDSPYYKYLIGYPPRNVEYFNTENQKGAITKKSKFILSSYLKRARHYANKLRLPFPNMRLTKEGDYNLIHCTHCLSRNKNMPWVADFESYWQFWLSGRKTKLGEKWTGKILSRKNCKKIIAWTNLVRDDIIKIFPNLQNKIEVVYPAVPTQKSKKKHKGINLLFIGRYFYGKGGLHAIEAIDRITKKRKNTAACIVSDTPDEIFRKYSGNKKIKFLEIVPQKKLFEEIYPSSDIFVYPGYSDTFGFSMLEAMSFGIPTITVEGDVKEEIIDERKTGFIVSSGNASYRENIKNYNKEVVEEMVEKALKLIDNRKLLREMAKNCIKTIKDGKFSIKQRNEKLEKVYQEALR